jgi:hypothetical protein
MAHTAQELAAIEKAVSRERLSRYLAATSGDLSQAISLYESNVALSEVVFGLMHGLEVAVRNSMHQALTGVYRTPEWYGIGRAPLSHYGRDKVAEAVGNAGGVGASPGKVVAELMFGFWTDLAAHRYHWSLWQPCLVRAFPGIRLARPIIHARLDLIRKLRNRVAHHEPILTSGRKLNAGAGLSLSMDELVGCAGWIAPEVEHWLRGSYRFDTAVAVLEDVAISGVTL